MNAQWAVSGIYKILYKEVWVFQQKCSEATSLSLPGGIESIFHGKKSF